MNEKKMIIIGDSAFAEIAYEYFTHDSEYEIIAFSVEREYLKKDSLFQLPVVVFEELQELYNPLEHYFFAAMVYKQENRLRTRLYEQAKGKGFTPASYISSKAFVWQNCKVGEHCFIFEDNTVQPFVNIGDNVILWSGNHIGHHSVVHDNCFISSHVVISGFCNIGEFSFLGVNSTISNNINIGKNCTLGAGSIIVRDVPDNQTVVGVWNKK
ncbi:MAG: acetyltransferase [Thermodesulfobacteriota bacterium]|nr:acetyltransferase [Thermodesulfobacteriota bacterium]